VGVHSVGIGLTRRLAVAPWSWLALCPAVLAVINAVRPSLAGTWLLVSMAVFFLMLLARIVAALLSQPARRPALLLILAAMICYAAGSAALNGSGTPDLTTFPAPGEWFFLAFYVCTAGYLLVDAPRRTTALGASWLETVIICGGAACLTASVLMTVAANRLAVDGLPLLLALLYPLIDVVLALLVVAQVVLGLRDGLRGASGLLAGFVAFAAADSDFLLHLSSGTYQFGDVSIVVWGAALALITGHACRARRTADAAGVVRGLNPLVVAAGMAAAFVLAFEPTTAVRTYLIVPALATLVAAGVRLTVAVRAANLAAEAITLARSDDLTSLPNRRAVLAALDRSLSDSTPLGLMILDLDGFKDINDALGHPAGDTVLREIGGRMRAALDKQLLVARLGGDEFAVVAEIDDEIELMELAQTVLAAVREPLSVDGITLSTGASIGITVRTDTDTISSDLLRRADVAMYEAKESRAGALIYDPASDEFSRERLRIAADLRQAIHDGQLVVWYQPQLDATTRRVCGLEALVRWQHPEHGVLAPAMFLPAARRAGLMQALSEEVGRIVVADLVRWRSQGTVPRVALNCGPPELMSGIFIPPLHARLAAVGISADHLVIEVTEDSFLADPQRARELLNDLRGRGFQISIDDYGTGFSSLSYLHDLPVQELKIDRSFVAGICADPRSRMIVASTFQMAAALGLRTVAEGVENAATAADLIAMGVDVLQGYYISKPLPPDQVLAFVRQAHLGALSAITVENGQWAG
jgi:diguanylate cyclase (GGDEF)-like protein